MNLIKHEQESDGKARASERYKLEPFSLLPGDVEGGCCGGNICPKILRVEPLEG